MSRYVAVVSILRLLVYTFVIGIFFADG